MNAYLLLAIIIVFAIFGLAAVGLVIMSKFLNGGD